MSGRAGATRHSTPGWSGRLNRENANALPRWLSSGRHDSTDACAIYAPCRSSPPRVLKPQVPPTSPCPTATGQPETTVQLNASEIDCRPKAPMAAAGLAERFADQPTENTCGQSTKVTPKSSPPRRSWFVNCLFLRVAWICDSATDGAQIRHQGPSAVGFRQCARSSVAGERTPWRAS